MLQPALKQIPCRVRTQQSTSELANDWLINEQAIALVYNGISHAVMMTTPSDLLDFAIGFSLAENIIERCGDILDHEIIFCEHGIEVQLTINSRLFTRLKHKRRSLTGTSGCGLCGVEALDQTIKQHVTLPATSLVSFTVIAQALTLFKLQQGLNNLAGAVHGAAFCSLTTGAILCLREDVGRHNALDKLVGALAVANAETAISRQQGFILLSSRASFEMVDKTIAAGIRHLVTMSAATSKAVDWAKQHNLNLIGFARSARQVIYAESKS